MWRFLACCLLLAGCTGVGEPAPTALPPPPGSSDVTGLDVTLPTPQAAPTTEPDPGPSPTIAVSPTPTPRIGREIPFGAGTVSVDGTVTAVAGDCTVTSAPAVVGPLPEAAEVALGVVSVGPGAAAAPSTDSQSPTSSPGSPSTGRSPGPTTSAGPSPGTGAPPDGLAVVAASTGDGIAIRLDGREVDGVVAWSGVATTATLVDAGTSTGSPGTAILHLEARLPPTAGPPVVAWPPPTPQPSASVGPRGNRPEPTTPPVPTDGLTRSMRADVACRVLAEDVE